MTANQDIILIQELQKTPKWKEFEEWYNGKYKTENILVPSLTIDKLHFDYLKGIFEKFIESEHGIVEQKWVGHTLGDYSYRIYKFKVRWVEGFNFEDLLIWYFYH